MASLMQNNMTKYIMMRDNEYTVDHLIGEWSFSNNSVSVKKANSKAKQVSFLNVPSFIPDKELIHFASKFGKIVNLDGMIYEKHCDAQFAGKGINTGMRRLDIEMEDNISLPGFIWLEGMSETKHVNRITVKHSGQDQSCYHCLKVAPECKGGGNRKMCKKTETPKVEFKEHMNSVYKVWL